MTFPPAQAQGRDIALEYVATLNVQIGAVLETGSHALGNRRLIPIVAGQVSGPRLSGMILPGGADSQIVRDDGQVDLSARYMIETADGARIYVENNGLRRPLTPTTDRAAAQSAVNGESEATPMYFRTVPRFETANPAYAWLTQSIFVCTGVRRPTSLVLDLYRVL